MPTERELQIEEAARRRAALASGRSKSEERKAAEAEQRQEAIGAAAFLPEERWGYWSKGGEGYQFAYTAQPVNGLFLSCVRHGHGVGIIAGSVVAHKRRRDAKQRAWNLFQGYRLCRGLETRFGEA